MTSLPLYYQIFLALRDRIINGEYDWQEPMPGEVALAKDFSVSRSTIRKALDTLEEEGLIVRSQGSRTYARSLGYDAKQKRQNLEGVSREENYRRLFSGDINQNFAIVASTKELKRQFDGELQLARVARVRDTKGKPFCLVVSYLPLHIANKMDWETIASQPVISAAENAGYSFEKVEQTIRAMTADEETSVALGLPVGSPVLRISGLFLDSEGRCMMRKDGLFRPDSFEYRTTIYKTSKNGQP